MLTWEEDVEAAALRAQGWTIAAIARHLGRDRKTIRATWTGTAPRAAPLVTARSVRPVRRLRGRAPGRGPPRVGDRAVRRGLLAWLCGQLPELHPRAAHPWAAATLRGLRRRQGPRDGRHRASTRCRAAVGLGRAARRAVGWQRARAGRGVVALQPGPRSLERIGGPAAPGGGAGWGAAPLWRHRQTLAGGPHGDGDRPAHQAAAAKHYGVAVDACPPRRGNRKGVVEKAVHFMTQRWWRTAQLESAAGAQASLDRFWATTGDARPRWGGRSVGELGDTEPLQPLPIQPYPATVEVQRVVTASCTIAFRGNHYSVPPGLVGSTAMVRHRLGTLELGILSAAGVLLATHRLAPPGAGRTLRLAGHAAALERVVLQAFTTSRPCQRKANRPPGAQAQAAARQLHLFPPEHGEVTVDLARYAELAGGDQ